MIQLGILCAMEGEYNLLYDTLYNQKRISKDMFSATTKRFGGKNVLVLLCGIGKVNAADCARQLINRGVMNVISVGVAGAADELLNVGDIVVGNSYCYHDVWCGEPNRPGQIQGFPSVFPSAFGKWIENISKESVKLGTIATGDWFVQDKAKIEEIKSYLPQSYNVIAVDMESAAIAQICYKENIPFLSIRIISDNPYLENHQEQYKGFWNDMARQSFEALTKIIM